AYRPCIGLLLPRQHPEQGGLARAIRSDDTDNAAGRQLEGQIFDQNLVAIALSQALDLDDDIAQPLAGGNDDLRVGGLAVLSLLHQFLIGLDARFRLGLTRLGRGSDPLALAPDRLLARVVFAALLDQALGLCVEILGVVALVGNSPATV